MLLTGARLALPEGIRRDGWIDVADGVIRRIGDGPIPADADDERVALGGRLVAPGFVDLHAHGGGGHSLASADADEVRAALATHRERGTTSMLAGIVTAPVERMVAALRTVAELAGSGEVLGAYLEGPFLNPRRAGAHDPADLRAPDLGLLDRLLEAGEGHVRMVTLAPELPGAEALVDRLVAADIVVAIGHSDADSDAAQQAVDRGATHVTHLFNGMRPFHHRDPGLAGAALAEPRASLELIADGIHVHDLVAGLATTLASGRIALVTDAASAAGGPPGPHRLGERAADVVDGASRLADGTLAGSLLTMDAAVRHATVTLGMPLEAALAAASVVPARVLGLEGRIGGLVPGRGADLVVLGDGLRVDGVMAGGVWVTSGRLFHT